MTRATAPQRRTAPAPAGAVLIATRLAAVCLALALLLGAAGGRPATRERPPTGVTGGFGEPTCQLCHFEAETDTGPGRITLTGIPATYAPGRAYPVTVTMVHRGMEAAGFEIAARFEGSGAQAGTLAAAPADAKRVEVTTAVKVQYGHHLWDGTEPVAPDTARWRLVWTAPASAGGTVSFHAVGNASNGDNSPLGDYVYTVQATSRRD